MKFTDLSDLLNNGRLIEPSDINRRLKNSRYAKKKFIDPSSCPNCGSSVKVISSAEEIDEEFKLKCKSSNKVVAQDAKEQLMYEISYEALFNHISDTLGTSIEDIDKNTLPKHVRASTSDNFSINLIVSEHNYDETVDKCVKKAVKEDEVTLLLTPRSEINDIFESFEYFSVGSVVCPYPFEKLDNPEPARKLLENSSKFYELSNQVLSSYDFSPENYLSKSDKNPMVAVSELNYMEILRRNGEIPPGEEDRLEHVVASAFSHLGATKIDRGGRDDSGRILPDVVANYDGYDRKDYGPTLCLIDSKSGKNASFSKEKIERKHKKYLDRVGDIREFDGYDKSLIFVAFGIDGHQEIKFFDALEKHLGENDSMIIIYSQALGFLLEIYHSTLLNNEVKLSTESFDAFLEPFLNKESFCNETDIQKMTRFEDTEGKEEYKRKYRSRRRLIVITPQMVRERLSNVVSNDQLERILDSYFKV